MKFLLFLCLFGIFGSNSYADDIVELDDGGVSQEDIDMAMNETLIVSGGSGTAAAGTGYYTYRTINRNSRLQKAIDNLENRADRINTHNENERQRFKKASTRVQKKNPIKPQSSSWTMDKMRNFRNGKNGKRWWSPNRWKLPVAGIVTAAGTGISLSQLYFGFQVSTDELDELLEDGNCCINTELEGLPLNDRDLDNLSEDLEVIYKYGEDN